MLLTFVFLHLHFLIESHFHSTFAMWRAVERQNKGSRNTLTVTYDLVESQTLIKNILFSPFIFSGSHQCLHISVITSWSKYYVIFLVWMWNPFSHVPSRLGVTSIWWIMEEASGLDFHSTDTFLVLSVMWTQDLMFNTSSKPCKPR